MPAAGCSVVMLGGTTIAKGIALLALPFTVTTTGPLVAPAGTIDAMLLSVHVVTAAAVPFNFTVLAPCVGPKFAPLIATASPTAADVGFSEVMLGGVITVKTTPLLVCPPTVTTTAPLVAAAGTTATTAVLAHA